MSKRDLVVVEWGDAWSASTWTSMQTLTDEDIAPVKVVSVGWVVAKSKRGLYLASRICHDGDLGSRMFIPRGMISKITKIPKHTLEHP